MSISSDVLYPTEKKKFYATNRGELSQPLSLTFSLNDQWSNSQYKIYQLKIG